MYKRNLTLGIILILIGAFSILNQFFNLKLFSMSTLWPLFILIPGLLFEFGYFSSRRDPGLLVPGGILTTIGALFLFETFTGWRFAAYSWPVYPLAVAIGLFQLYIFGRHEKGLLIPVTILTAVSVFSFTSMVFKELLWWFDTNLIFPAVLILTGLLILFSNRNGKKLDR
jgi:hypothetical protein